MILARQSVAFRAVTIILYWLFVAAFSFGQSVPRFSSQNPSPIVRIISYESPMMGEGTGTVAWDNGQVSIVYTAAHVVKDAKQAIAIVLANGHGAYAKLVNIDIPRDMAALLIRSQHVTPIEPGPYRGGAVTLGGYGGYPYSGFRLVQGNFSPHNYNSVDPGQFEVTASVRQGDSGGPVINNGKLIGILWGGGQPDRYGRYQMNDTTMIRAGEPFLRFHEATLNLVKNSPIAQETQCRNGQCFRGSCQSCGPQGCGGPCYEDSCVGGSCYGPGPPPSTPPTMIQPPNYPTPTPAPATAPAPSVDLTPITNEVKNLHSEIDSFAKDYKPCNCDPQAMKNVQIDITTLQTSVASLEKKVDAFKSCNCDHSTTDQRIDELEKKINDNKTNNQTPSTTVAPRRFEGVIKRVQ